MITIPELEQKGAGMPYTSVNGNMFSFLSPDGSMALRLGKEDREIFIKKYKTGLKETHGTVMKEYVAVPDAIFKNTKQLEPWFTRSFAFMQQLKAKPSKKQNRWLLSELQNRNRISFYFRSFINQPVNFEIITD